MEAEKKNVLFALSTCAACKKTRELLDKNKVDYLLVEVDKVDLDSREKILTKVRQYNAKETFPTLVMNSGEQVIVGYSVDEFKRQLNIE